MPSLLSPARSTRPLCLVMGLKEKRTYQLGMMVKSEITQKYFTHTHPWNLSACTPRYWGRCLLSLCICSPSAFKGHGDSRGPQLETSAERQLGKGKYHTWLQNMAKATLRNHKLAGLPSVPGKIKEWELLKPMCGNSKQRQWWEALSKDLPRVNDAWPTWLPSATKLWGQEESKRCHLPLP